MARKDWKKQLFRVKQIADQNFGRVEKTEALNANLQALEKTVDQYGKVFSSTGKKLLACLQTQPGQDIEKRQKKLPEYVLSNQLIENSQTLGIDTLIGLVFQITGDAEAQVANKTLELELGIEEKVLSPIHKLIENDIPAITKLKKNLQRVVLDMDSAKTRYHAAQKEQTKGGSNNPQSSTTKVDNLREEYDEAYYKVEQCRDQLATEMFTLASREAELSKILLELIKCQASYHKAVLDVLEKRIPQMEEQIQFSQHVPVFGKPIEDHLQRSNRKIALVIEVCVKKLIAYGGLEEEGLFRIAGAANKIKKLKAAFDSEQQAGIDEENDVHVVAGTLKLYLRELPDPLMKSSLYSEWMKAAHMPADQRLQALAEVLAKLPKANSENLRFLIKFLHKMSAYQEVNKMSPSNLSIVMGPNLIWPQGENGPSVLTTSTQSLIVEAFISHCDYFFPGDDDDMELNSMNSSSGDVAEYETLNTATSGEIDCSQTSNTDQTENKLPAPDRIFQGGAAHVLVSSLHAGISNPVSAFESMSSSTGSLNAVDNSFGSKAPSPKPPRRTNKKPAPLPPAERPHVPAPPPPCHVDKSQSSSLPDTTGSSATVTTTTCATTTNSTSTAFSNLPYPIKPPLPDHPPDRQQEHLLTKQDKQQEHPASTQHDDKQEQPKAKPERPPEQHHASAREERQEFPARPDRPPSPKNVRPLGPPSERPQPTERPDKPARPEKPDKPGGPSVERLYPSLSPTTLGSAPAVCKKSPSTSSGEHSPPHMGKIILNAPSEVTEKPPLPPPPGVKPDVTSHSHHANPEVIQGHRRQSSGSTRPLRPQPPPPPPPNKPTSVSQQVESSEKQTFSGGDPDNQTPSSPKTGEDTYL